MKLDSMKFVLFLHLGAYVLSMDWVDFYCVEWHEIRVITQGFRVG